MADELTIGEKVYNELLANYSGHIVEDLADPVLGKAFSDHMNELLQVQQVKPLVPVKGEPHEEGYNLFVGGKGPMMDDSVNDTLDHLKQILNDPHTVQSELHLITTNTHHVVEHHYINLGLDSDSGRDRSMVHQTSRYMAGNIEDAQTIYQRLSEHMFGADLAVSTVPVDESDDLYTYINEALNT